MCEATSYYVGLIMVISGSSLLLYAYLLQRYNRYKLK